MNALVVVNDPNPPPAPFVAVHATAHTSDTDEWNNKSSVCENCGADGACGVHEHGPCASSGASTGGSAPHGPHDTTGDPSPGSQRTSVTDAVVVADNPSGNGPAVADTAATGVTANHVVKFTNPPAGCTGDSATFGATTSLRTSSNARLPRSAGDNDGTHTDCTTDPSHTRTNNTIATPFGPGGPVPAT